MSDPRAVGSDPVNHGPDALMPPGSFLGKSVEARRDPTGFSCRRSDAPVHLQAHSGYDKNLSLFTN